MIAGVVVGCWGVWCVVRSSRILKLDWNVSEAAREGLGRVVSRAMSQSVDAATVVFVDCVCLLCDCLSESIDQGV